MPDAPNLDRLERWMLAAVSHPRGAATGVDSGDARAILPVTTETLEDVVLPSAEQTALERLAVYAGGYFLRLIEVLEADFPTVQHLVGKEAFDRLCRGYLVRHPSRSYTLNKLGASFPEFLAGAEDVPHRAFAADVARIEWAMEEVFDAEAADPAGVDPVLSIPANEYAGKRFRLVPACRLLRLDHPANDYLTALREDRHMDVPPPAPSQVVVYRDRDLQVFRITLSPEQAVILERLAAGDTLGEALGACAELPELDVEAVIAAVGDWFREWSACGLFAAIE